VREVPGSIPGPALFPESVAEGSRLVRLLRRPVVPTGGKSVAFGSFAFLPTLRETAQRRWAWVGESQRKEVREGVERRSVKVVRGWWQRSVVE
jgi:hypothetical protein